MYIKACTILRLKNFVKLALSYQLSILLKKPTVYGLPWAISIEPINLCNLKCPECPTGTGLLTRSKGMVSVSEFHQWVIQVSPTGWFVNLYFQGEPFMHPQLPDMIRYASKHDIKTLTSTNAHFLQDNNYLKRILTSGLTTLIVAIDSLDQDMYEIYRKKGRLSKAVEGLRNLVQLKKKLRSNTRINLRMVIMKQNEHELEHMRSFAKKIGVDVFTVKTVNPSCGLDAEDELLVPDDTEYRRYKYHNGTFERVRREVQCRKMWFMCNISANGEVIPCGYDYTSELKVGNIFENPLSQIWNSSEARSLRKRLYYEKESIPKCKECGINYELTEGGWFPETINFDEDFTSKVLKKAHGFYLRSPSLQRCARTLPFLKKLVREIIIRHT